MFNDFFYHFIPIYYVDFIKSKDINQIYQNQPDWNFFEKNSVYEEGGNFLTSFRPESLFLGNLCLYFTTNNYYIITDINISETIKIYLHRNQYDIFGNECNFEYEQPYPKSYMKYKNENDIILILDFDGDYVDIWINSKKDYLGKYYAVPKTTLDEIHYIVSGEQRHSPEKIYYPRHADGSSDFDDEIKPPMVKLAKPGYEKIDAEKLYNEQIKTSKSSASSSAPAENLDRPPFPDKKDPDYWKILQKYYPDDYPPLRFEYLQKRTKIINTVVIPCAIVLGIILLVVLVLVIRKKRAK